MRLRARTQGRLESMQALHGFTNRLGFEVFLACLGWRGLSGQRGAVLRRHGLGRQVGGHAVGVTPLRCSRQGGAFELAARPAGAPLKQLRPARDASALRAPTLPLRSSAPTRRPSPCRLRPWCPASFVRAGDARTPLKSGQPPARLRWLGLGCLKRLDQNTHGGQRRCETNICGLLDVGALAGQTKMALKCGLVYLWLGTEFNHQPFACYAYSQSP